MRPDFGAGLQNSLYEQNTITTRRQIQDLVTLSLTRWEKRISIERVDVTEAENRPTAIRIEIAYKIKRSNQAEVMGLTMDLES